MSDKETYIKRYETARAEMREIVKLAQGNPQIYSPWRMKEVLDHITGWDDAVIASINNAGPGLNQVGPATTYAVLTDFQTWICTIAMLLGRLELLTVLVVFTRAFWRA